LDAIKLSTEIELEQLLHEKAALEEELHRLEGQQKELSMRARAVCEKIIQELKNKTTTKRAAINQLRTKVDELEAQLEKISMQTVPERANQAVEEAANGSKDAQEKDDNIVILTAFDSEEKAGENTKTQQEAQIT
jgi:predicted nuclease with TOPRIM domain